VSLPQTILRYGAPLVIASAGLLAFLTTWEDGDKPQPVVYADPLVGIPTACGGITKHTSPVPVVVGEYWSAAKCEEIKRMVVAGTQMRLIDCFTRPIPQKVFEAFSSHAHNFGDPSTCASRAVGLINAGRMEEGCDAIAHSPDGNPVWSYVGATYVRGLYRRRLAERQMCLLGLKENQ
jgi:GH24 family phage-related lysozyme (muramidase)